MGLDQHAHLRGQKVDWEQYYSDDDYGDKEKVFVWRKHARLQQFMAKKWDEQNWEHSINERERERSEDISPTGNHLVLHLVLQQRMISTTLSY
mgnify:CR=1 FL=1